LTTENLKLLFSIHPIIFTKMDETTHFPFGEEETRNRAMKKIAGGNIVKVFYSFVKVRNMFEKSDQLTSIKNLDYDNPYHEK
jgi:hypothetical protein